MRRVVITGMGIVSPLGVGLDHNWTKLIAAESGLVELTALKLTILPARLPDKFHRMALRGHLTLMRLLNRKNSVN